MLNLEQATSFTRCPNRWRSLSPQLQEVIEAQRLKRPLCPEVWAGLLPPDYPDREFLLNVLEHGLPVLPPEAELAPAACTNYKSCIEHKALMNKQLSAELAASQLLRQPPGEQAKHIHALAAIPKSADDAHHS